MYFSINTDPAVLSAFDDKYGTRRYRGIDGVYRYAWEDDDGWATFLDQIVRPVISNALREQIGSVPCSELQASCALVQNGGTLQQVTASTGKGNLNIAKIQKAINETLAKDFDATLDGHFVTDIRFNLAKITLPQSLQDAINRAQAAFAAVTEAQAKVQQAQYLVAMIRTIHTHALGDFAVDSAESRDHRMYHLCRGSMTLEQVGVGEQESFQGMRMGCKVGYQRGIARGVKKRAGLG